MSALGHSLPKRLVPRLARCPEYPESRHEAPAQYLTGWATNRLMHHSKKSLFDWQPVLNDADPRLIQPAFER